MTDIVFVPVLAGWHARELMDDNGWESTMNVLIWGVILLGGIGFFVVWGLSNAYPTNL